MNITGKITWVGPVASGTSKAGKDWNKFNAVITEQEGEYPQYEGEEMAKDQEGEEATMTCAWH